MSGSLGWLMGLFGRWLHWRQKPPRIDRVALREEMSQDDPDFARVRDVHHDALQALTADGMAQRVQDGLAIRREREFWERHGQSNGGASQ